MAVKLWVLYDKFYTLSILDNVPFSFVSPNCAVEYQYLIIKFFFTKIKPLNWFNIKLKILCLFRCIQNKLRYFFKFR